MQSTWEVKKPFGYIFKSSIFIFLSIVTAATVVTIWYNQALAAPGTSAETKNFVIKKGETLSTIVAGLDQEGLIKNSLAFRIYLKTSGLDVKIQAGNYELRQGLSARDLAQLLTEGRFDKKITIREGLRKEEIAQVLGENFGVNKKEFLDKAKEGYLFPDTYLVPSDAGVDQLLEVFEENFNKKVSDEIIASAQKNGISKNELIIFASIVEREAKAESQRPTIAGILIKRWKKSIALGTDATIQYALGYSEQEKIWWRKILTVDDLQINSNFNTRTNVGLPPGPISSPGIASIKAVANPKASSYFYYLHDGQGNVYYADTLKEHEQNIAKYLN